GLEEGSALGWVIRPFCIWNLRSDQPRHAEELEPQALTDRHCVGHVCQRWDVGDHMRLHHAIPAPAILATGLHRRMRQTPLPAAALAETRNRYRGSTRSAARYGRIMRPCPQPAPSGRQIDQYVSVKS